MVGGTLQQQQQQQQPQASQLAPPLSSSSTPVPVATTEEEEFLKRNTDCVYFLASPLTCKKGSECEYRHSDIARVNPRDCWYWLNGNCLNPKCAFRHPPLDGLLGAEVPPPVGPALPQAQTPSPHGTPYPMSKQGVPCIFFQKGFCLKGHLCPFLHGPPNISNNKTMPPVPSNNVTNPSKIASEKPIQEQKFVQQETEFPPPKMKQNPTPARNGGGGGGMEKKAVAAVEEPRYRPANVVAPPVVNEYPVNRSNHGVYETHHVSDNEGINGKDVEEYSREPTPGFDVLVDNELGDSEYYPNEEQFGRSRGHDFEMGRPVDYDVDQDIYGEPREGYAWEDHRESSERILGGAHNFGRKRYPRDESPDQFDKSDLRHRISNQRRGNFGNVGNVANVGGLRSVISREHPRDNHTDRMPRRDIHHHDRHNNHNHHRMEPVSISSRLRGRIKIPETGSRVEREFDMGRHNRSRYSPRPPHGRFRDRINEGRDYRGPRNGSEFTKRSPKDDGQSQSQCQPLGKRKYGQQVEEGLSFEGPKPLSEILKRKRGGSVNNDDNNNLKENNENGNENERKQVIQPRSSVVHVIVNKEESGLNDEDENERKQVIQPRSSVVHVIVNKEESGLNDEDALLDEELEAYDHKDGDYDYEQIDGEEEYNLEEGEEYMEEEEEGGKKESQVYS